MKKITGGELLILALENQGISQVFSIPGEQLTTIYDAIDRTKALSMFTPRNETSVPLMACGYTASTGKPCVSMTTVGAGVSYELSGLLFAWLNYLPILSIAPQVQSWKMKPHQENLQGCNQDELFYPVTKWNSIIYHWQRIPQLINRAFREALTGAYGPIHLDIPVDILFSRQKPDKNKLLFSPDKTRYQGTIRGDHISIAEAQTVLKKASNPLIIMGQGIGRIGKYENIRKIIKTLPIPVFTTRPGTGITTIMKSPYQGDLSIFLKNLSSRELLDKTDLLIIVGYDYYAGDFLSTFTGDNSDIPIIQIETDPGVFLTARAKHFQVQADPISGLERIFEGFDAKKNLDPNWIFSLESAYKKQKEELLKAHSRLIDFSQQLESLIEKEDLIIVDGKFSESIVLSFLENIDCHDLHILDSDQMGGAGIPFAIGAAIGCPERRVFLICDNNSLYDQIQELQPLSMASLKLAILCINQEEDFNKATDTLSVLVGFSIVAKSFQWNSMNFKQLFDKTNKIQLETLIVPI